VTTDVVQARGLLLGAWLTLPACSANHASAPPPPPPPDDGGSVGALRHPGVLVNAEQLAFVKGKVASGAEPWSSAYARAKASPWASLAYQARPRASVDCGSNSNPDFGCKDEQSDVIAAYTDALVWAIGGEEPYAQKAVEIMNAWSAVLQTHTLSNALVQAGWTGSVFARAGEIVRHTYGGWPAEDVDRFAAMLRNAYLPLTIQGTKDTAGGVYGLVANGNWGLVMIEASTAIAVFTDDRETFDHALAMWEATVPSYVYLKSDGPTPVPPPGGEAYTPMQMATYWGGQSQFTEDGIGQETCRDFHHLEYGFAAMIDAAETARIQGVDLYAKHATRLVAGFEFNAQFLDGVPAPAWLCGKPLDLKCGHSWEIGYNEFANRLGMPMPHTKNFIQTIRPTDADHHMVWETLSHAEVGAVGLD
jgi:hypothetical protein